jgi:hypothetical protein
MPVTVHLGGSACVSCAPLSVATMSSTETVEQVSEMIHTALNIYEDTCERFQSDGAALSTLRSLHAPLERLAVRLESVTDNDEARRRLDEIVIGDQARGRKFLAALSSDVQFVSTYLRDLGRPGQSCLEKDDVVVYSNALVRYSEVLKLVLKKSTQYVPFAFIAGYDKLLIFHVVILYSRLRTKYSS